MLPDYLQQFGVSLFLLHQNVRKMNQSSLVCMSSSVYQCICCVIVCSVGGSDGAFGNIGWGGMPFNFGVCGGMEAFLNDEVVELLPKVSIYHELEGSVATPAEGIGEIGVSSVVNSFGLIDERLTIRRKVNRSWSQEGDDSADKFRSGG